MISNTTGCWWHAGDLADRDMFIFMQFLIFTFSSLWHNRVRENYDSPRLGNPNLWAQKTKDDSDENKKQVVFHFISTGKSDLGRNKGAIIIKLKKKAYGFLFPAQTTAVATVDSTVAQGHPHYWSEARRHEASAGSCGGRVTQKKWWKYKWEPVATWTYGRDNVKERKEKCKTNI